MSNVNKNNNKGGVCQCQEMNKISDVCLFLVLDANHRGHLQKKRDQLFICVLQGVFRCVCVRQREMHMSGTLCPLHQMIPKQLWKEDRKRQKKVESRGIETDMQRGTERDQFNKPQLIPVKIIPQAHPAPSVYVGISQLNNYLFPSLLLCLVCVLYKCVIAP